MTEHVDLIKKIASGFNATTKMEFDELVGVASIGYAKAVNSYKPDQGSALPTWLYANMRNVLIDYVRKERTVMNSRSFCPIPEQIGHRTPERDLIFSDAIDKMSESARNLCQIVFDSPAHFVGMTQKDLLNHLRDLGWTYPRIWDSFKEIKSTLQSIQEE